MIFSTNNEDFKRLEMIEVMKLKMEVKKMIIGIENKKEQMKNVQKEIDKIIQDNNNIKDKINNLNPIKKEIERNEREYQINKLKEEDYINKINSIINNDRKDYGKLLTREDYEKSKKETKNLNDKLKEKINKLNKLKNKYNELSTNQISIISKLKVGI
jgi:chromosome segregation ATPase